MWGETERKAQDSCAVTGEKHNKEENMVELRKREYGKWVS